MSESFTDVKTGVFDPSKRFAFTNITEEMFTSAWGGQPINVPAGATIELPHHLAVKLTKELVDKIMIGNAKLDEVEMLKSNPMNPLPRSPRGMSLGVPAARKIWEDKIVRELEVDEESPEMQVIRAQIKQEILADLSKEAAPVDSTPQISGVGEFADLDAKKEEPVAKKPLRVKKIKVVE